MLTEKQVADFKANGFVKGGRVLTDEQVYELREQLQLVIDNKLARKPVRIANLSGKADAPVWQIVDIWEASDPYKALVCNRQIAEEVAQLTGATELRLWHDQIDFLHTLADFKSMPATFEGHEVKVQLCPVRKGEVHFHHALTWHGSDANTSGRPRRAIALHYMTQDTVYVASGNHIMKPFVEVADGQKLQGAHLPQVWPQ